MRRWLGLPALAGSALLALLLAACGSTSTTAGIVRLAPATTTPTKDAAPAVSLPTVTPSPTTSPLANFETQGGCTAQQPGDQVTNLGGGLQALRPGPLLQYPRTLLPANLSSAPHQLSGSEQQAGSNPNPYVDPTLLYAVTVCNPTARPLTLAALGMRIESFQPSSGGTVNQWGVCDGFYDASQRQLGGGGCGGAYGGADVLQATFTTDAAGATAQATSFDNSTGEQGIAPPLEIEPGKSAFILVQVAGLTADGTYQLSFQFTPQGQAPVTIAPLTPPILVAQNARTWTGQNCERMAAQIPHASQSTLYVCPPTS